MELCALLCQIRRSFHCFLRASAELPFPSCGFVAMVVMTANCSTMDMVKINGFVTMVVMNANNSTMDVIKMLYPSHITHQILPENCTLCRRCLHTDTCARLRWEALQPACKGLHSVQCLHCGQIERSFITWLGISSFPGE